MMKNIFFTFLLGLFVFSCSKEDDLVPIHQPGDMEYGWASGFKNGKGFLASGEAVGFIFESNEYFGVVFDTYSEEGFHRENIVFSPFTYSLGLYKIEGSILGDGDTVQEGIAGGSYGTSTDDGDVAEDSYKVDASAENTFEITEVDTVNNIVKGRLHVEFELNPIFNKKNPANPDHVVFSDMEFEVSFR